MIDLHCHSTASDGSLAPREMVALAEKIGLTALALTDHDTLQGLMEFQKAGEGSRVECIPGIELATQDERDPFLAFHLVGLFLKRRSDKMDKLLDECLRGRVRRNIQILERLNALGIPVTKEEVFALAGGDVIGRPHIARALMQRGVVPNMQAAFDRYIGTGKPAYVRRVLPTPAEAISAIHSAGGCAVWAHPFSKGHRTVRQTHALAVELKAVGLDGIEVHYALHTQKQIENAAEIARAVGLLPSGGSDFHGENTRSVQLGLGLGHLQVPDRYLEPLRLAALKY